MKTRPELNRSRVPDGWRRRSPAMMALILAAALLAPERVSGSEEKARGTPAAPTSSGVGAPGPVAAPAPTPPVYCPVCGAENPGGSRFCQQDGSPIPAWEPGRVTRNFARAPETFSPEEIQAAVQQAARSVVRVRIKAKTDFRIPAGDEDGRGYVAEVKDESHGIGSGFVIEEGGWVVTNAHVAAPFGSPAETSVETVDGRAFPARVAGFDLASDLALLQAEGLDLPVIAWGDSDSVQLGEEVWALGNPLNIGLSLTRGTISSMVRVHIGMNQVENFLHSDAFFTSGNSGGPLVSVRGLVLGVNDMAVLGEKGQGYSIPSRMARLVTEQLRKGGKYDRGYLGLQVRPIDSEMIEKYGLRRQRGMVVESVLAGAPAEKAGFKPGDVIYGIDNRAVGEAYLFQEAVSSVGPGAQLPIRVDRGGQAITLPVTTVARPAWPRIDPLQDLERYLQASFVEDPKRKKVVVQARSAFSVAAYFGLMDGDRVESVLAAGSWTETPLSPEVYRALNPVEIRTRAELREALGRMYLAGRIGIAFGLRTDRRRASESIVQSLVLEEKWAVIV